MQKILHFTLLSALVVACVALVTGVIPPEYFERIKVLASVLTPLVILLLGLVVNQTLERHKTQLAIEKGWKDEWAKRFYGQVISYNGAIEDVVTTLFFMMQENNQKLTGWEKRVQNLRESLHEVVPRIQRTQWTLITMCEFCPKSKEGVISTAQLAFNQASELLKNQRGDLEAIRKTLHSFNMAAMKAHGEILGLP